MLSPSVSLCLSLLCAGCSARLYAARPLFSPPVVIENGQLSALRHVLCEKQGEEQYIAL